MAKNTPKKKKKKGAKSRQQAETRRWVAGVILFLFGLFLLIAVAGYFFSWRNDQTFANWEGLGTDSVREVSNPAGRTGAKLVAYVVGDWFGVFGIVIPVAFILIGVQLLRGGDRLTARVVRTGVIMFALAVLGSLSLGLLFPDSSLLGSGPGGAHGRFLSGELKQYVGFAGTGLLLLLGWILLGVYINSRRTMNFFNRIGRGIGDGGTMVGEAVGRLHRSHEEDYDEDDDEPEDEEDDDIYEPRKPEIKTWENTADADKVRVVEQRQGEYADRGTGRPVAAAAPEPTRPAAQAAQAAQAATPVREPVAATPKAGGDRKAEVAGSDFVVTDLRGKTEEPAPAAETAVRNRDIMWNDDPGDFVKRQGVSGQQPFDGSAYAGGVGGGPVAGAFSTVAASAPAPEEKSRTYSEGSFTITDMDGADKPAAQRPASPAGNAQAESAARKEGAFTITDLPSESPAGALKPGGVVEAAGTAVGAGAAMKVVAAGRSDVQLDEDDIDDSLYDPTKELSRYQRPPVEILEDHSVDVQVTEDEIYENKNQIVRTLENFGIKIDKIKATIGPTVTLYEIIPSAGVKISKIKNLEDDIALSLKALGIRIIAPMPGKGTVGIEVPNKDKEIVSMYSVVKTRKFQESTYELPVVLGKTISNETMVIDLAAMPHLLVAGATGQGKSVGLNAIITSLLYRKHPAELKFVLVDPKRVELSLYSRLEKHFLAKMESEDEAILTDTNKVVYTLNALCTLMSERYDLLRLAEVKKISEYNAKFLKRRLNPNKGHKFLPYIVVIIDEFADMIMTAGREVEAPITRLAQLARAVGIHLVIATQRPDVKVITGLIKANFPARIAFRVTSMVDSRTILDQPGANQLIGRGDMLFSLNGEVTRVQCAFIDTPEIERITEYIGNQKGYPAAYDLPDYQPEGEGGGKAAELDQVDAMFEEVARAVVQAQEFSTSWIQRNYGVGYNRAGRITDQLERAGIIGKANGSKPREVLIYDIVALDRLFEGLGR